MHGEYISIDGKLQTAATAGEQLKQLLGCNYTYRNLHASGGTILHLDLQLSLLELSCTALFGRVPDLDRHNIAKNIGELLYRNSASRGSNLVRIAVAPGWDSDRPSIFILYCGPLMYNGYNIWHKPLRSLPLTYEIPFPAFKTAANLLCHDYSREHARSKGYDCAVTVNYAGHAVSLGQDPLFCIRGRDVFVADAETSSPQSVERILGIELCHAAGLKVFEKAPLEEELTAMDELFSFSPQGIVPIGSVATHLFPSSMANLLEKYLPDIAAKEFQL